MNSEELRNRTQEAAIDYLRKLGYVVLSAEEAEFITQEIEQTGPCDVGSAQIKALLTSKPL